MEEKIELVDSINDLLQSTQINRWWLCGLPFLETCEELQCGHLTPLLTLFVSDFSIETELYELRNFKSMAFSFGLKDEMV